MLTVYFVIYIYARPGLLKVQLSDFLINWTEPFVSAQHIRRKHEIVKHSAIQNS